MPCQNIINGKSWSKEEDAFLKANYGKFTVEVIAEKLDRTPNSVYARANRRLNLRASSKQKNKQIEIDDFIEDQQQPKQPIGTIELITNLLLEMQKERDQLKKENDQLKQQLEKIASIVA